MIGEAAKLAAKLAHEMFDLGQKGASPKQALDHAVNSVPNSLYSSQIKAAIKKEFAPHI